MRKVFIDCGGHVGESIQLFKRSKRYDSSYEIYSFEPVEQLAKKYKHLDGIVYSDKAVWIYDGEIDFYLAAISDGNSLFKDKKTGGIDREHPIKVACIDFSKWVQSTFNKDDYIILKIDIEGAEFKVLDKMIRDGSIEYINSAYVEWHFAIGFEDKYLYKKLLADLSSGGLDLYSKAEFRPEKI